MLKETKQSMDWIKTRSWDIQTEPGHVVERLLALGREKMYYKGWSEREYLQHFVMSDPVGKAMPEDARQEVTNWLKGKDMDLIEKATKKGTLDWSPKENWVDKVGGLPKYIERIALALIRERGMPRERAIPVAINRVKMWAAGGGDVNPDTRAKAAKAVAEWEAKKAKARATKDD